METYLIRLIQYYRFKLSLGINKDSVHSKNISKSTAESIFYFALVQETFIVSQSPFATWFQIKLESLSTIIVKIFITKNIFHHHQYPISLCSRGRGSRARIENDIKKQTDRQTEYSVERVIFCAYIHSPFQGRRLPTTSPCIHFQTPSVNGSK